MPLGLLLFALLGREAECRGDRKAASRHGARGIGPVDGGGTVGVEKIGEGRPWDRFGDGRSRQAEALNVVRVEKVGCAQPDLGPIEDGAIPDGVVDVGIDRAEGRDDGLVMIGPLSTRCSPTRWLKMPRSRPWL